MQLRKSIQTVEDFIEFASYMLGTAKRTRMHFVYSDAELWRQCRLRVKIHDYVEYDELLCEEHRRVRGPVGRVYVSDRICQLCLSDAGFESVEDNGVYYYALYTLLLEYDFKDDTVDGVWIHGGQVKFWGRLGMTEVMSILIGWCYRYYMSKKECSDNPEDNLFYTVRNNPILQLLLKYVCATIKEEKRDFCVLHSEEFGGYKGVLVLREYGKGYTIKQLYADDVKDDTRWV